MTLPNTKEAWEELINSLKTKEELSKESKTNIIKELAERTEKTILSQAKVALTKGKIGVLFSGGVDSTLISYVLKKHDIPFKTITIGFWDEDQKLPEDILESREPAKELDFDHKEIILSFKDMEEIFEETVKLLGPNLANAVNVGVGSVEVAGINEFLKIDKDITQIFGGLGSEELFAGYKRHEDASDKHEECWAGLKSMFNRDLLRDSAISNHLNIEFYTPFLDKELISFAMNIPIEYKINDSMKKIIIRESAMFLGLPEKFAFRPKRAAQYGARTDNALAKLARQNGFKYKKDYIKSLL